MVEGVFIERLNRFVVSIKVGRSLCHTFMADPGRMKELLIPGTPVWVFPVDDPDRKTKFNLALIRNGRNWVGINSHLPNALFAEAVQKRRLLPFAEMSVKKKEVTVGRSRLDFLLTGPDGDCFVEIKSVTLVEKAHARFPDAPTERGARHMNELIAIRDSGLKAAVCFIIQRSDARLFSPNESTDPKFTDALRRAHGAGVDVWAFRCAVGPRSIRVTEPVTIRLGG